MALFNDLWNMGQDLLGVGNSSSRVQNQLNREFQERMSGSEIQRRMADARSAGVNPIFALGAGSGAGTVTGSSGVSQNPLPSSLVNVASKINVQRSKLENELLKEQVEHQRLINSNHRR